MKLLQSLLASCSEDSPLLDKIYQVNVIPCLVAVLRFYFEGSDLIQMTLIYDALKLLNLVCSYSASRTQQAARAGLMATLKGILVHIQKLNDQFSSNKKIKLYKQILILFQDNITYGNDFTKVEMLNFDIQVVLIKILGASMTSIRQYALNCQQLSQAQGDSQREKIKQSHLYSKVEKDHQINQ